MIDKKPTPPDFFGGVDFFMCVREDINFRIATVRHDTAESVFPYPR